MLTDDVRIRKSPSAAWREIEGEIAIVSTDVNRFRLLNRVGGFVWKKCDKTTLSELVSAVCARFAVDEATARLDVERFVEDLAVRGLVQLERPG